MRGWFEQTWQACRTPGGGVEIEDALVYKRGIVAMAAQLTSDGAAQPDSSVASSAVALGELDITSTEVSLKGAGRLALQVPGGSHTRRHSQPTLIHS